MLPLWQEDQLQVITKTVTVTDNCNTDIYYVFFQLDLTTLLFQLRGSPSLQDQHPMTRCLSISSLLLTSLLREIKQSTWWQIHHPTLQMSIQTVQFWLLRMMTVSDTEWSVHYTVETLVIIDIWKSYYHLFSAGWHFPSTQLGREAIISLQMRKFLQSEGWFCVLS